MFAFPPFLVHIHTVFSACVLTGIKDWCAAVLVFLLFVLLWPLSVYVGRVFSPRLPSSTVKMPLLALLRGYFRQHLSVRNAPNNTFVCMAWFCGRSV